MRFYSECSGASVDGFEAVSVVFQVAGVSGPDSRQSPMTSAVSLNIGVPNAGPRYAMATSFGRAQPAS